METVFVAQHLEGGGVKERPLKLPRVPVAGDVIMVEAVSHRVTMVVLSHNAAPVAYVEAISE